MDLETRSHAEHAAELRLWLRLLSCTQRIEATVRGNLRADFGTTLPRFDLMAQLERHPEGMKMNELSQRLMVSNGNVTGITDQLTREGLVERIEPPDDRRAWLVRLTALGRTAFADMAVAHEAWIVSAFESLAPKQSAELYALLGQLKTPTNTLSKAESA